MPVWFDCDCSFPGGEGMVLAAAISGLHSCSCKNGGNQRSTSTGLASDGAQIPLHSYDSSTNGAPGHGRPQMATENSHPIQFCRLLYFKSPLFLLPKSYLQQCLRPHYHLLPRYVLCWIPNQYSISFLLSYWTWHCSISDKSLGFSAILNSSGCVALGGRWSRGWSDIGTPAQTSEQSKLSLGTQIILKSQHEWRLWETNNYFVCCRKW